jgi:hypothetical protein
MFVFVYWRFRYISATRAAEAAPACKNLYRIFYYWRFRFFNVKRGGCCRPSVCQKSPNIGAFLV